MFFALSAAWLVSLIGGLELIGNLIVAFVPVSVLLFVYLPWAVRRFYRQSRLWTALKTLAVLFLYYQLLGLIVSASALVGIWDA